MSVGCSKNNTSNVGSVDKGSEVNTEADEDVIINLEKMEKYTYGYEQVQKDTAVIAGNFETNSTEINIEFSDLSEDEQIVATIYSKDDKDTIIGTETVTKDNPKITFTNLTSAMTYILELKNTSNQAVDIDCLISQ